MHYKWAVSASESKETLDLAKTNISVQPTATQVALSWDAPFFYRWSCNHWSNGCCQSSVVFTDHFGRGLTLMSRKFSVSSLTLIINILSWDWTWFFLLARCYKHRAGFIVKIENEKHRSIFFNLILHLSFYRLLVWSIIIYHLKFIFYL